MRLNNNMLIGARINARTNNIPIRPIPNDKASLGSFFFLFGRFRSTIASTVEGIIRIQIKIAKAGLFESPPATELIKLINKKKSANKTITNDAIPVYGNLKLGQAAH